MTGPRRFVVLRHIGIAVPHFDLLLDVADEELLESYETNTWPPAPGVRFLRKAPHRRVYLQYEGEISNDRGSVSRIADGYFVADGNELRFGGFSLLREGDDLVTR